MRARNYHTSMCIFPRADAVRRDNDDETRRTIAIVNNMVLLFFMLIEENLLGFGRQVMSQLTAVLSLAGEDLICIQLRRLLHNYIICTSRF